jgi:hypothetical protein
MNWYHFVWLSGDHLVEQHVHGIERTKARVRERAGNRCEYCKLHQEDSPLAALHVEHDLRGSTRAAVVMSSG